jgi:hypothetical protein
MMMNIKRGDLYALYVSEWLILLIFVGAIAGTGIALFTAFAFPEGLSKAKAAPLSIHEGLPVIGEVVMIEGTVQIMGDQPGRIEDVHITIEDLYVVKFSGGEAVHFHVNETTWMDEELRVGNEVEVWASEAGEALFIIKTS